MIVDPVLIEQQSLAIISRELVDLKLDPRFELIIKRVIHATADFDFIRILEFHPDFIEKAFESIGKGVNIYADTRMIVAGVNKNLIKKHRCSIYTLVDDEASAAEARSRGITRSIIGIEKALQDENTRIFVIGNAPTALFRLNELITGGRTRPDLIIGVPVGFVGAAESKEAIKKSGIPYIVTAGRKGGSPVAAAILNAILYQME
jgi:precorrin-8X/cobalt-precorrin-8 methylmutase